jgi:hypothetical protein
VRQLARSSAQTTPFQDAVGYMASLGKRLPVAPEDDIISPIRSVTKPTQSLAQTLSLPSFAGSANSTGPTLPTTNTPPLPGGVDPTDPTDPVNPPPTRPPGYDPGADPDLPVSPGGTVTGGPPRTPWTPNPPTDPTDAALYAQYQEWLKGGLYGWKGRQDSHLDDTTGTMTPGVTFAQWKAQMQSKPPDAATNMDAYVAWLRKWPGLENINAAGVQAYRDRQAAGSTSGIGIDQWWAQNGGDQLLRQAGTQTIPYNGGYAPGNPPYRPSAQDGGGTNPNGGGGGGGNGQQSGTTTGGAWTKDENGAPVFVPFDPEKAQLDTFADEIRKYLAPGMEIARDDLQRRALASAAARGQVGAGGYGVVEGRALADLTAEQESMIGQLAVQVREAALARAFQENLAKNDAELQKWVKQNEWLLQREGYDAQRYMSDNSYRASLAQAAASQAAAAAQAGASMYNADRDYAAALIGLDITRENNLMDYLLGIAALGPEWAKWILASDPLNLFNGGQLPGDTVTQP